MSKEKNLLKASFYIEVANQHRERLTTLQGTEWNMYYGMWVAVLVISFTIIQALPQFSDWIWRLSYGWGLRIAAFGLCVCFYGIVWRYFFRKFYENNYKSLTEQRSKFTYYMRLSEIYSEAYNAKKIKIMAAEAKNEMGNELKLEKEPLERKLPFPFSRLQEDEVEKYRNSGIYDSKVFVLTSMMVLMLSIEFALLIVPIFSPVFD